MTSPSCGTTMELEKKISLVGTEVRAADGGDYGHRIVGYNPQSDDFMVISIRWSTGEMLRGGKMQYLDAFKASYRYVLSEPRHVRDLT